ncbi:hypothetical protein HanRHA438_Chr07g0299501 [Helianthus annuus]|nr:hypothetical protein HanRHA438_Chr07g0299501 [Helianthus annuus]
MLQVPMSSSESGLSEEHDPMVVTSDDELAQDPEIFTLDTESDPDMISDDEDDFQPFALCGFGDDVTDADDILIDDVFALPIPVHDHLIIGHPDGELLVAPLPIDAVLLAVVPPEDWPFDNHLDEDFDIFVGDHPTGEQGDREVDDIIVLDVPPHVVPVIDISSDSSIHSVADSFESVTSSALRAVGLRLYATDDDDAMSAALSSPIRAPPPHPLMFQNMSMTQIQFRLAYPLLHLLFLSLFLHPSIFHPLLQLLHSLYLLMLFPLISLQTSIALTSP